MSKIRITSQLRTQVFTRANKRCEYCQSPSQFATQPFAVEHIIPLAKGGLTESDNLALSCAGCNGHKYTKTKWRDPVTDQQVPLFNPREDVWAKHFAWGDDYTLVIRSCTNWTCYSAGITPESRRGG